MSTGTRPESARTFGGELARQDLAGKVKRHLRLSPPSTQESATTVGGDAALSIRNIDNLVKHPLSVYPDAASLGPIVPPFSDCERIVDYTLERTSWLHACVHAPTFRAEVQQFWAIPHETRLHQTNPAWLSLFFAQICCGLRHSTRDQLDQLGPHGLSDQDVQILSKAHFDAAVACLYRSHPLENRQLHAVQAIAVLVIACQDGALSNVFPSLLSLGIAMAQDLGLHRLPSDASWAKSVAALSPAERRRSLVLFETKKRIFWALTSEDWFSVSPHFLVNPHLRCHSPLSRVRYITAGCRPSSRRR